MAENQSTETEAERDRRVLAALVDTMADIAFDGGAYDGYDIQEDLAKLGVLAKVQFDPAKHTDHDGDAEPGDDWFEWTPYGKGLLHVAAAKRRKPAHAG